ncbi:MAG: alpha/beta hydrolase [Oscillospiraceae bacterium]|nr:alpha/beta hydrolase [Oscillospiraceae bacterium]
MIYEKINLPHGGKLTAYCPDNLTEINDTRSWRGVLICPGGAYAMVSQREAEPIALQMVARDICAFVLEYDVAPARYPTQLLQAAEAMAYIKENKEKYYVNEVAVMGFSAGGHLAASLGTKWHETWLSEKLCKPSDLLRPDSMVLCYPVITAGEFTHAGSMENLTGSTEPKDWEAYSLEKLVSDKTPRTFLWHTWEDEGVPVENSLLFASALRKAGVLAEMHIYPHGSHGQSLSTERVTFPEQFYSTMVPAVRNWIDMAARWIKEG